jgi:hypothetical protein
MHAKSLPITTSPDDTAPPLIAICIRSAHQVRSSLTIQLNAPAEAVAVRVRRAPARGIPRHGAEVKLVRITGAACGALAWGRDGYCRCYGCCCCDRDEGGWRWCGGCCHWDAEAGAGGAVRAGLSAGAEDVGWHCGGGYCCGAGGKVSGL